MENVCLLATGNDSKSHQVIFECDHFFKPRLPEFIVYKNTSTTFCTDQMGCMAILFFLIGSTNILS